MDAKGRIAIPQRVREELAEACGGSIVITAHTEERCLLIYPEPHWLELMPQVEQLPNIKPKARRMQRLLLGYATPLTKARRMQRLLLGYATPLTIDGNGRVLLSPTLREYARLEKKLMLVGQGKKLELWNEEHWNHWLDEVAEDDDMPEEILSLSL